jgi:hypothetical protein
LPSANDSKKAPFAPNIKYTENAARLPLNEGLWFTAVGLTDYKVVLADPQGGAADSSAWSLSICRRGKGRATRFSRCV